MMKHNWRTQQQNFFDTEVEFLQDKRILDFFDESPLEAIGDVSYFKNKLPFYNTKHKEQCLIIINRSTMDHIIKPPKVINFITPRMISPK